MAQITSFRDLDVYQMAMQAASVIYLETSAFPKAETYALTSQIRASSRAVCALLAEGWGRRRYVAAFANKVNQALGEALETQAWLDHALQSGYIQEDRHEELDKVWQQIGGKLKRIEQKAESFCNPART
jgi:four helix bundle protein